VSDGPWQSLPLGPQWKRVAKRVETDAFTLAERREALEAALAQAAEGLPLKAILRMVPNGQGHLFGLSEVIEALRQDHPGSKSVQTFLTCVSAAENGTALERGIVVSAVADMLNECLFENLRSIEEHYIRKKQATWGAVEARFETVREAIDIRGLASRIVAESGSSARVRHPPKRSGLDEGPRL
jgi:hypothetical protein